VGQSRANLRRSHSPPSATTANNASSPPTAEVPGAACALSVFSVTAVGPTSLPAAQSEKVVTPLRVMVLDVLPDQVVIRQNKTLRRTVSFAGVWVRDPLVRFPS